MALSACTVLSVQPLLERVSTSMKGNVDRVFLICSKCWIICVYLLKTKIVKPVLYEKRSCIPDRCDWSAQSPYVRQDACMMPVDYPIGICERCKRNTLEAIKRPRHLDWHYIHARDENLHMLSGSSSRFWSGCTLI